MEFPMMDQGIEESMCDKVLVQPFSQAPCFDSFAFLVIPDLPTRPPIVTSLPFDQVLKNANTHFSTFCVPSSRFFLKSTGSHAAAIDVKKNLVFFLNG